MNFENIQMVVVRKRSDGSKINIIQINEGNRYEKYECIVCGSDVIPVAPEGKIIGGATAKVTPHFKHLNADKCGTESFTHFWMKTEFIKIGDCFKVITDKENEYICNQIFFEKTIVINGRRYTPDATVLTSCGNTIHFEYNYSNKKKVKDYIDIWKELNNIIIEADMNSILSVFSDSVPTFKALYYEGKCFNLNDEDNAYYRTIGEYKLTKHDENYLESRKIEIENLDNLWEEIRKIKYENKDYSEIGNFIRSITSEEGRKVAIAILSRARCGNSILGNYVTFIKTNIDKRLKLLNLKYSGYLIRYETEVPRLIYDRIFNGVTIKFYIPDNGYDSDIPVISQTYNYNFKDEILSNMLKIRIDTAVKELLSTHTVLLKVLDVFQSNKKVINYKLNYKINTDYIDAIYFEDYRNKHFVLTKSYNCLYDFKKDNPNIFSKIIDKVNKVPLFIKFSTYFNSNSFYICETKDSYEFNEIYSYSNEAINFKFDKFIKQCNIDMSYYLVNNNSKFLPRYNFVSVTSELNALVDKIEEDISNIRKDFINTEYFTKVYEKGENIEIVDLDINKKIYQLLYPIIYLSNKCDHDDALSIKFNKDFTKDESGKTRAWLIKDFISVLNRVGITGINNIK